MADPKKIAVLGAGKLGEALIRGLVDAGAFEASAVTATAGHPQRVTDHHRGGHHGEYRRVHPATRHHP